MSGQVPLAAGAADKTRAQPTELVTRSELDQERGEEDLEIDERKARRRGVDRCRQDRLRFGGLGRYGERGDRGDRRDVDARGDGPLVVCVVGAILAAALDEPCRLAAVVLL